MALNLQVTLMVMMNGTSTKLIGLLNAKPLNSVIEAEAFRSEVESTWDNLASVTILVPDAQTGLQSRMRITKAVLDQSIPMFTIIQSKD